MKATRMIVALALVLILATGTVFAGTVGQTVNLTAGQTTAKINGQEVTLTAPAQVVSGRTLVPLRFVGEAFGCDVQWVPDTKTAVVTFAGQVIEVPIGQNYVTINGDKADTEVPGQLINGSTFVPLRLIGESLGAKLDYNPTTKEISILMNAYGNEANNFKIVVPAGWSVDSEDQSGVYLTNGADGAAAVLLTDKTTGITPDESSIDTLFADDKSKEGFAATVDGNAVYASYNENGNTFFVRHIFSTTGIYTLIFSAPTASFTEEFGAQCDLISNTLSDY